MRNRHSDTAILKPSSPGVRVYCERQLWGLRAQHRRRLLDGCNGLSVTVASRSTTIPSRTEQTTLL